MKKSYTPGSKLKVYFLLLLASVLFSATLFAQQKQFLNGQGIKNHPFLTKEKILKDYQAKHPQAMPQKKKQQLPPFFRNRDKNTILSTSELKQSNQSVTDGSRSECIYTNSFFYYSNDSAACGYYNWWGNSSHCIGTNTLMGFYIDFSTCMAYETNQITVHIDFGDGTDTLINPQYQDSLYGWGWTDSTSFYSSIYHTYSDTGSFVPEYVITTYDGYSDSSSYYYYYYCNGIIHVTAPCSQSPDIINFTAEVDSSFGYYCYDHSAYFSLSLFAPDPNFYLPNADTVMVLIDYGDGNNFTYQLPLTYWYWNAIAPIVYFGDSHTYLQTGTYQVNVLVTFPDGTTATATSTVSFSNCVQFSGKVFMDENQNCLQDGNEQGVPWAILDVIMDSTSSYPYWYDWIFTDSLGNFTYSVPADAGNGKIMIDTMYQYYSITSLPLLCPSAGYYSFNSSTPTSDNDFALVCQSGYDMEGWLWGWRFRPGFQGYLYPYFSNFSCDDVSGTVKLFLSNLNIMTIDSVSPAPSLIAGDTVIWQFNNLNIQSWWNYATVYVTTSLSAQIGDTVVATLLLEPLAGDVNPSNNIIRDTIIISNSWDPNEKKVSPQGIGSDGLIGNNETLDYVIHFQNTGSDTAYNISVVDTINQNLDVSTLKIISSSHYLNYQQLDDNVVQFYFPYIMLPDSGQNQQASNGYVAYEIKAKPNLPEGAQITNTAYIYFDYNEAVITNTTLNTISLFTEVAEMNKLHDNSFIIYPNPTPGDVFLKINGNVESEITITDVVGKIVFKTNTKNSFIQLMLSYLNNGVYFVTVKNENSLLTQKLCISSAK